MNTPRSKTLRLWAGMIAVVCLFAVAAFVTGDFTAPFVALGLGMGFSRLDNDSQVYKTKALPAAAGTVITDGIDLMNTSRGDFQANVEVLIQAPALDTTELPNAATMIYDLYHAASADFSDEVLLQDNVITQTGAGGAGDAAVDKRVRLPVDVARFIRVKVTGSATIGDCSADSVTMRLAF
jgi:hypothetical protein